MPGLFLSQVNSFPRANNSLSQSLLGSGDDYASFWVAPAFPAKMSFLLVAESLFFNAKIMMC